jgi:HEAT repeat protein
MRFRLPSIDIISFWVGFLIASLFWWVISMLRPAFKQIVENNRKQKSDKKEASRYAGAIEDRYRQAVLQAAQGMHLAAPLFSLDEILVPPQVLAPPIRIEPGTPLFNEDIVDVTLPYMPTWPELAATYNAQTLTLGRALSGNSDIVLVGQTGMGKTVALASLASSVARRDPVTGLPPDLLPILVHIADLSIPSNGSKETPTDMLVGAILDRYNELDQGRIPDFIGRAFSDGRVLLLVDGTDELTPDRLKEAVEFIKSIKKAYPKTRMVTTASTEYLDGLVTLNFIPLYLAAWNHSQRDSFLSRWGDLWNMFVAVETWAQQSGESLDPILLNAWLLQDAAFTTPLELTLKAWGAYAGDTRGPRTIDILDAHIRRLTPANTPRAALDFLALQIILNTEPVFDPRKAREWVKNFDPDANSVGTQTDNDSAAVEQNGTGTKKNKTKAERSEAQVAPTLGLISKFAATGLLATHRANKMRFAHPIYGCYLAGKALSNLPPQNLLHQPAWIGKNLSLQFLAAQGDASPYVDLLSQNVDRPLFLGLLTPARWLKETSRQATWKGKLMAKLAELIHQRGQPLGLRGQAMAAIILSGDPGAALLFRQMLEDSDTDLIQLAALGCGAIRDQKAIPQLTKLSGHAVPSVRRSACLALACIGTQAAMDALAGALLRGDENLKRAAAEAMANHSHEGYAMLKEGATMSKMEDLDIRRAVVYGLGRIHQTWADELIMKMQLEDDQWAVRDACTQVLEERQKPDPHIPVRLVPASEAAWLISFASKQGVGVSMDKMPVDLLLSALKSGDEEEKLASLSYLRVLPSEPVFAALYHTMYAGGPTLREATFRTISEMALRGVEFPDPLKYGVGA